MHTCMLYTLHYTQHTAFVSSVCECNTFDDSLSLSSLSVNGSHSLINVLILKTLNRIDTPVQSRPLTITEMPLLFHLFNLFFIQVFPVFDSTSANYNLANYITISRSLHTHTHTHTHTSSYLLFIEWHWKVWLQPWVYRVLAICLAFLSLTIVWSEVTFSVAPHNQELHISFFAFLVYAGHKFQNYITVEVRRECVCT